MNNRIGYYYCWSGVLGGRVLPVYFAFKNRNKYRIYKIRMLWCQEKGKTNLDDELGGLRLEIEQAIVR